MSIYSAFETDASLETGGVWIDYGPDGRFRVARAGGANKNFTKKFQRLMKPHRRAIQAEALQDEAAMSIMVEVFVDTVLLGWERVTDREGKNLAYSKTAAKKLFADLPELFQDLMTQSQNYAVFLQEIAEVDAGN